MSIVTIYYCDFCTKEKPRENLEVVNLSITGNDGVQCDLWGFNREHVCSSCRDKLAAKMEDLDIPTWVELVRENNK